MGNHQSRIDAKGRMSIPALFRATLRSDEGAVGLVLRPSHVHPCIEAWPVARFAAFAAKFDQMDQFSADQDDLATTLYSDAWPVEADKEGRIVVPESLVKHAALTESATFMGLGDRFQIWEPNAAAYRRVAARASAAARGLTLPGARA